MKYLKELIADIKHKKELQSLDDAFVERKIKIFLDFASHTKEKQLIVKKLNSSKSYKQFTKCKEHDFLVKSIRAELRKIYGVFQSRQKLSADLEVSILLAEHQSTRERISYYDEVYKKIFSKIGEKKHNILDLACGLNPISAIYIKKYVDHYFAVDISESSQKLVIDFFDRNCIKGNFLILDLTSNIEVLSKIKTDVCFMFKALDSLERSKRGITAELFDIVNAKYFIVSFPKVTISGKNKIHVKKRKWFFDYLEKEKWLYHFFEIPNESFYIIEKL
jgi:hypothetical protein